MLRAWGRPQRPKTFRRLILNLNRQEIATKTERIENRFIVPWQKFVHGGVLPLTEFQADNTHNDKRQRSQAQQINRFAKRKHPHHRQPRRAKASPDCVSR